MSARLLSSARWHVVLRRGVAWVAGFMVLGAATVVPAAHGQTDPTKGALPVGMSFVAQDTAGEWRLYRVSDKHVVVPLVTQHEPRQACVTPDGSKAVYAAADGTVRTIDLRKSTEDVIARADRQRAYTQPCMSADGRQVLVVEMAEGKSLETEILEYTSGSSGGGGSGSVPRHVARQSGAQHDPFIHQSRWLVYASVGCSVGCEELLVEIWTRDLLTGKTRQLTLLNAVSQSPVTDGRRVVFTSNASGTYQLWQVGQDGTGIRRLTGDGATQGVQGTQALHPALCGGELYFVQSGPAGAAIARMGSDGTVTRLPTPGLKSVRALRCLS